MLYKDMSREELSCELESLKAQYEEFKAKGLALDLSRGKPCSDQLDIMEVELITVITEFLMEFPRRRSFFPTSFRFLSRDFSSAEIPRLI